MKIKFLGTHNAESKTSRLPSFLIDEILAVDAGSLASELTLNEQKKIEAILLSHGHYDHIRDIPAFAFNNFNRVVDIFGTKKTLDILSSNLLDGTIYPNFAGKTPFLEKPSLKLHRIKPSEQIRVLNYKVASFPVNHPLDSVGFEITNNNGKKVFYTGDAGSGLSSLWDSISPDLLIIEVTFPNKLIKVANDSYHLCPLLFKEELNALIRVKEVMPKIIIVHLSPSFESEIKEELNEVSNELSFPLSFVGEGETVNI